jgi:hypothetical protein
MQQFKKQWAKFLQLIKPVLPYVPYFLGLVLVYWVYKWVTGFGAAVASSVSAATQNYNTYTEAQNNTNTVAKGTLTEKQAKDLTEEIFQAFSSFGRISDSDLQRIVNKLSKCNAYDIRKIDEIFGRRKYNSWARETALLLGSERSLLEWIDYETTNDQKKLIMPIINKAIQAKL